MGVIINASTSLKKDVTYRNPIVGKSEVSRVLPGVFNANIVDAVSDSKCSIREIEIGEAAKYYGSDFSGEGYVSSETRIKQGGGSATPYVQHVIGFMGVER